VIRKYEVEVDIVGWRCLKLGKSDFGSHVLILILPFSNSYTIRLKHSHNQ